MISFIINSKTVTTSDGKRTFKTFWTYVKKDGEEKPCSVKVKFNRDNVKVHFIEYGQIDCEDSDVNMPYDITPYTKDGQTIYPYIWIDKIAKYTALPRPTRKRANLSFVMNDMDSESPF